MNGSTSASRRRLERGEFTWVGALFLVLLLGAAYLGYAWWPVYWLHYEVKHATRAAINEAVHQRDDRLLVEDLCRKLRQLGQDELVGPDGRTARVPAVDLEPREVTWERDTRAVPPTLRAAFQYVRVVRYPWTDRTVEKTFSVDIVQDIDIPRW
jgi:hypothetical protein